MPIAENIFSVRALPLITCFLRKNGYNLQYHKKTHLRHSGLRTIKGGICWGLPLRLPLLTQLLLLGYQRMLSSLIFKGSLVFSNLLNITNPFQNATPKQLRIITLLSANLHGDFWKISGAKTETKRKRLTGRGGAVSLMAGNMNLVFWSKKIWQR